ncbi:hypothetical protein E2C01_026572 [Portunus trituberculatus]|uniref:Uncharacterized protein n=1 Tax=Portunus trituberculatus TaxID=210409 RepID=A0A5B7EJ87_PORTR|nr:hypothetical protein [Portunus trituberculatus]
MVCCAVGYAWQTKDTTSWPSCVRDSPRPSPAPSGVTCAPPLAGDAQNNAAGPLPHNCKTPFEQASSGSRSPPGLIDK